MLVSRSRLVFGLATLPVVAALLLAAAPAGPVAASDQARDIRADMVEAAEEASRREPTPLGRERTDVPEDRYALAGGCYAMTSVATGRTVRRVDDGYDGVGEVGIDVQFHLQATDLGSYLLFGHDERYLAASEGVVGEAAETVTDTPVGAAADGLSWGTVAAVGDELTTGPAGTASGRGSEVVAAELPSELADWELTEAGGGAFRLALPALGGAVLAVDPADVLVVMDPAEVAGRTDQFTFALTEGCAEWPDIEPGIDGEVVGGQTPYGETAGYVGDPVKGSS